MSGRDPWELGPEVGAAKQPAAVPARSYHVDRGANEAPLPEPSISLWAKIREFVFGL